MKKLFFFIAFLFATANTFSQVYVQGHTRSNGTTVQSHLRTAPNSTVNDNWSTQGNVNPYTGEFGNKPRSSEHITTSNSTSTSIFPTTNSSSSNIIYTGSRGGTYTINSNGNKTYISR